MSRQDQIKALLSHRDKIVIVGQQPNSNSPDDPLSPDDQMWAGYRLMQMLGTTPEIYRSRTHRININYKNLGKFQVGPRQRSSAQEIFSTLYSGDTLIMMGVSVEKCFRNLAPESVPCKIAIRNGLRCIMIPHPSGRNRWYNDPTNTARAAEILRAIVFG